MKAYWDSSALVQTAFDSALRTRLRNDKGITRTHALSEVFAALTGNPAIRADANQVAQDIQELIADLEFVDLTAAEVAAALKQAKRKGVRGGHVHDLLHAAAADKAGVAELLTQDINDFQGLSNKAKIVAI